MGILEDNAEDIEQGGVKAAGVRIFLQSHCPVGVVLWCGDVGGYPLHGTDPGGFPRPGGAATDGAATTEEVGCKVVVHLGGGGERGGGI